MNLRNIKRAELLDFVDERFKILRHINPTKLKDLLITTNQKEMEWPWKQLDSTLVALLGSRGSTSNPLNFYLTSNDGKFKPEEWGREILPGTR
jgi:hypothetical protein